MNDLFEVYIGSGLIYGFISGFFAYFFAYGISQALAIFSIGTFE